MLFALVVFAIAALLVLAIEQRLIALADSLPVGEWLTEHVYSPLLRILAVLAFVLSAYPRLFGLSEAPALPELLGAGAGRFDSLINWLLIVSLLFPLLPLAERLPGLILPLQGIAASCLLFHWLAAAKGVDVALWMGWDVAARVVLIGLAASWLARRLAGEHAARGRRLAGELLLLLAQLPAVTIYARALGLQLA